MHRIEALTAAVAALTEAINASRSQVAVAEVPKGKKQVTTATPEPVASTEPAVTPPIAEQAAAPATKVEASAPTYDDVRAAFLELNTKKGREATVAALSKLGAQKVPDIKPEQFALAISTAKELLA